MIVPFFLWHVKEGKSFNLKIFVIGGAVLAQKALVLLYVILLRPQQKDDVVLGKD
jgi:hypothetical protein